MAEATRNFRRRCIRLSEFDFDIRRRADVKQQAALALSRLNTKREDIIIMKDEVLVLTVLQKIFASVARTSPSDFEFTEEPKGPFLLLILEVCITAVIT